MYYYVDGYNLALRSRRFEGSNFQGVREAWICWLSEHSTELGLHVTLVFDSNYAPGISQRRHLAALEVVYTAQGETADEWILAALAGKNRSKQIVVVTSDKLLAKHARHLGAKTEPVEAFLMWLDKRIVKKSSSPPPKSASHHKQKPSSQQTPPGSPAQIESDMSRWQRLFEQNYRDIS